MSGYSMISSRSVVRLLLINNDEHFSVYFEIKEFGHIKNYIPKT